MAKVKNAFFSIGASGTVANLLTINQRAIVQYARKKPSGYKPATTAQAYYRQRCRDAAEAWHAMQPDDRSKWISLAAQHGKNAFAKYLTEWQSQGSEPGYPASIPFA